MVAVRCVLEAGALVGEGPVWCAATRRLWWVDILGRSLHRFDPATGADTVWALPEQPGCLALAADGRLVVALASGLAWFDAAQGTVQPFLPIEADDPATRLNDGRCDRQGRLWVGSMKAGAQAAPGSLYCAEASGALRRVRGGIGVPNATAFSPDGRTMYFADTPTRRIVVSTLDPVSGERGAERLFAEVTRGMPDGAALDAAGDLWVALWDGAGLAHYRPDGTLVEIIDLPARRPTCPVFAGAGLEEMYVTSARFGLADPRPADGGLLMLRPGARGLAESRFGVADQVLET